jgi:ABC-type phosphonate transport system ATPase subunit
MASMTPQGQAELASQDGDVLRVEHISKSYGMVTALTDVNLRLARGEVLGLIGRASCRERVSYHV